MQLAPESDKNLSHPAFNDMKIFRSPQEALVYHIGTENTASEYSSAPAECQYSTAVFS
jgi:hypothetical protein